VRAHARWLALSESHGYGIFLGLGAAGGAFAPPQHGALVLGPPRCGKTAAIVVPNILGGCGPVVAVSTKPDLLNVTSTARSRLGDCLLFDPSGTVPTPPGVSRVAWSPLNAAQSWSGALSVAEAMVRAARPGGERGQEAHWNERATALLAVAFHAGALGNLQFASVMEMIDRRLPADFRRHLACKGSERALQLLDGITATDSRELSGIWSTASSSLAGYRTDAAIKSTVGDPLDAIRFATEPSTLYVCAGSDEQRHTAPLVAGMLRDLRIAAYQRTATLSATGISGGPPMLFALDEVANIAPLHDLPTIVAEGGSQGVVTLACLQDLSQATARWGREAEGFLSLFQAKVVFPGIGDIATVETISKLAGEVDVPHSSRTKSPPWVALFGHRPQFSRTDTTRRERRLPLDMVAQGHPGLVLHLDGVRPQWLNAAAWFAYSELRAIVQPHLARESPQAPTSRPPPAHSSMGRSR
jgi:type IV secretory pathway TraG/TraD family ATPase VirD4